MRINLGCGDRYATGWTNVDHAGCPHRKDMTVNLAGPLPWAPGTISHAYAGHLLEHLTLDGCRTLLVNLLPRMAPGGILMVVGPDVPRAQHMAEAGVLDVTMDSLHHGAHRWPGDEHHWDCDPDTVTDLLVHTGWYQPTTIPLHMVDPVWPVADRGPVWQFAVTAIASIP